MLGPAAWSQIADRLEKTGAKSIITKVEADNRVMRLAIVKSGFRETAISRFRRLGLRQQTTVTGTGPVFDWLAEQLRH
jgi:hypothetical protein